MPSFLVSTPIEGRDAHKLPCRGSSMTPHPLAGPADLNRVRGTYPVRFVVTGGERNDIPKPPRCYRPGPRSRPSATAATMRTCGGITWSRPAIKPSFQDCAVGSLHHPSSGFVMKRRMKNSSKMEMQPSQVSKVHSTERSFAAKIENESEGFPLSSTITIENLQIDRFAIFPDAKCEKHARKEKCNRHRLPRIT